MTRTDFDREIQNARDQILQLEGMVERAMTQSVRSLKENDLIDAMYEQFYANVIDMVVDDPAKMERGNYALWAAHNLERMADRVTNVCERTVFLSSGELGELSDTLGRRELR